MRTLWKSDVRCIPQTFEYVVKENYNYLEMEYLEYSIMEYMNLKYRQLTFGQMA